MNELHEIRFNKLISDLESVIYILNKVKEKILTRKSDQFIREEELFHFLIKKINELKNNTNYIGNMV